jgi:hypothetical protein
MSEIGEISLEELRARRLAAQGKTNGIKGASVAARRAAETAGARAQDGRVTQGKPNDAGLVQLNVRVTPDIKNQVVHLARSSGGSVGGIVEAALKAYVQAASRSQA